MTIDTQIVGERIAREVTAKVAAEAVLKQKDRSKATSWWALVGLVCSSGLSVQFVLYDTLFASIKKGQYALPLFGFCAIFGCLLALGCFTECRRQRRRLDAAIMLLQAAQQR
jgi:lipid-A-disaccharide synthase-like uncharacterized protein